MASCGKKNRRKKGRGGRRPEANSKNFFTGSGASSGTYSFVDELKDECKNLKRKIRNKEAGSEECHRLMRAATDGGKLKTQELLELIKYLREELTFEMSVEFLESYLDTLDNSFRSENPFFVVDVRLMIAEDFYEMGESSKAELEYNKILLFLDSNPCVFSQVLSLANLALIAWERHDESSSDQRSEEAWKVLKEIREDGLYVDGCRFAPREKGYLLRTFLTLGELYKIREEYVKAEKYFNKAMYCAKTGALSEEFCVYVHLMENEELRDMRLSSKDKAEPRSFGAIQYCTKDYTNLLKKALSREERPDMREITRCMFKLHFIRLWTLQGGRLEPFFTPPEELKEMESIIITFRESGNAVQWNLADMLECAREVGQRFYAGHCKETALFLNKAKETVQKEVRYGEEIKSTWVPLETGAHFWALFLLCSVLERFFTYWHRYKESADYVKLCELCSHVRKDRISENFCCAVLYFLWRGHADECLKHLKALSVGLPNYSAIAGFDETVFASYVRSLERVLTL